MSLGTATLGIAPLEADADRLIGRALDLGINVVDTANTYGDQARFDRPGAPPADQRASAEEIVGRAIRGRRSNIVLTSKVMEPVGTDVNERGLSRRHIMAQIERSLKRLNTDHLDVYYAHHPDPDTPFDETMRAFDDLIRQGKIRYCALSTYPAWEVMEALAIAEKLGASAPVCVQVGYNIASRAVEADLVPLCLRHGLSLTVFGPLAGGLFAGPSVLDREFVGSRRWGGQGFSERDLGLAEQLDALSKAHGIPHAVMALGWLMSRPAVASAIIGPETIDELEANVSASDLNFSPELLEAIDQIGRPPKPTWPGLPPRGAIK
ncbi:aryl-alcohol dehydrogenase-like predicted oxidoreductase [Sphingomonas vulcanisoli]|uniref:Aryl-alcohol dehydrogenase-like predicted oxidoreductase n=1 Tax=Sphingomonas vulcanisoli TaxID=1658060 RepID=A0ABX0TW40_9SPHN|nr:aldo/keto reductase [Sphingomonas vulcanisoli]NIJ09258.1 aryl-alcohol dehydrogenase-like predicted oxidoreductase [Sphingomonas vulcanisoli]